MLQTSKTTVNPGSPHDDSVLPQSTRVLRARGAGVASKQAATTTGTNPKTVNTPLPFKRNHAGRPCPGNSRGARPALGRLRGSRGACRRLRGGSREASPGRAGPQQAGRGRRSRYVLALECWATVIGRPMVYRAIFVVPAAMIGLRWGIHT